jgi:hypothetical protein
MRAAMGMACATGAGGLFLSFSSFFFNQARGQVFSLLPFIPCGVCNWSNNNSINTLHWLRAKRAAADLQQGLRCIRI